MDAWYDDPARADLKTAEEARIAKEKADAEQKIIDDAAAAKAAADAAAA